MHSREIAVLGHPVPRNGNAWNHTNRTAEVPWNPNSIYGDGLRDNHHKIRRRHKRAGCSPWKVVSFVMCFLFIAVGVALLAILLTKESDVSECVAIDYRASMRFTDLTYSETMSDSSSEDFGEMARWFCKDLSKGLKENEEDNLECLQPTEACDVYNLRSGSVWIDFSVKDVVPKTSVNSKAKEKAATNRMMKKINKTIANGQAESDPENIFKQGPKSLNLQLTQAEPLVQCDPVRVPPNAKIFKGNSGSMISGDSVTLRCNPGYRFETGKMDQTIYCLESGKLNTIEGTCMELQCPDIPQDIKILEGSVSGNVYGSVVLLQCESSPAKNTSNEEDAVTLLKCKDDGQWNHDISDCTSVHCPDVTLPTNSELFKGQLANNKYGNTVVTQCLTGYANDVNDPTNVMSAILCKGQGSWDGELQQCQPVTCPDVVLVQNATVVSGNLADNVYNDELTLSCAEGMRFTSGNVTATWKCEDNGCWDMALLQCEYMPINGGFSEWAEFPECRSKCSGETKNRTRQCDSPKPQYGGLPCNGTDIEYEECDIDPCCTLVMAASGNVYSSSDNGLIEFDDKYIDRNNDFTGDVYTAPVTGYFFISFSGSGVEDEPMEMSLVKGDVMLATITNEHSDVTNNEAGVFSSHLLVHLVQGDEISVTKDSGFKVSDSDQVDMGSALISFSVFSYSCLMGIDGVAFLTSYATVVNPTPDITLVESEYLFNGLTPGINIGGAFDGGSGVFSAPKSGVYYFTLVLTVDLKTDNDIIIKYGGVPFLYLFANHDSASSDDYVATITRSFMMDLVEGDNLFIEQDSFTGAPNAVVVSYLGGGNDNGGMMTSFQGFLYDPTTVEPVAFFAANDHLIEGLAFLSVDLIVFETILVNEGNDFTRGTFTCRIPGFYFFEFSHGYLGDPSELILMKNETPMGRLIRGGGEDDSGGMTTRSLIMELEVGDIVYIKTSRFSILTTGYPFGPFGSTRLLTFLGFVLQ